MRAITLLLGFTLMAPPAFAQSTTPLEPPTIPEGKIADGKPIPDDEATAGAATERSEDVVSYTDGRNRFQEFRVRGRLESLEVTREDTPVSYLIQDRLGDGSLQGADESVSQRPNVGKFQIGSW